MQCINVVYDLMNNISLLCCFSLCFDCKFVSECFVIYINGIYKLVFLNLLDIIYKYSETCINYILVICDYICINVTKHERKFCLL